MQTTSNGTATHNTRYGWAAAIVLFILSAAELSTRVLGPSWPDIPVWASNGVSVMLAAIWTSTAIALLLRRSSPRVAKAAWVLSFASPFTMVAHALVTMACHALVGGLFLPAALLVVVLLKRTFDAGEVSRLRQPDGALATADPSEGRPRAAQGRLQIIAAAATPPASPGRTRTVPRAPAGPPPP